MSSPSSPTGCKARELERFFETQGWPDYRIRIHALKSVSKTIGAAELFAQAKDLEAAAAGADAPYLQAHHAECMALYQKISDAIADALGKARN